jgi:hypothetical protein
MSVGLFQSLWTLSGPQPNPQQSTSLCNFRVVWQSPRFVSCCKPNHDTLIRARSVLRLHRGPSVHEPSVLSFSAQSFVEVMFDERYLKGAAVSTLINGLLRDAPHIHLA